MITLAVDCMGGDHGPRVTLAACRQFLDNHPDAHLLLVGLKDSLQSFSHERATVVLATEVVAMDDPVEIALRRKKDSSMRVAIQQVGWHGCCRGFRRQHGCLDGHCPLYPQDARWH